MCLNLRVSTGTCCGGISKWRWILARWQCRQALAKVVASLESPFDRWQVAGISGYEAPSRCSKTGGHLVVRPRWFRSLTFCMTMRIAQLLAGEETLYLPAEDLVEGHVP